MSTKDDVAEGASLVDLTAPAPGETTEPRVAAKPEEDEGNPKDDGETSKQETGLAENSTPADSGSEEASEDSPAEEDAFEPSWIVEGQFVSVIPLDDLGAELEVGATVGEEQVLCVMSLSPLDLRILCARLGEVIMEQDFEQWVAAGNAPEAFVPQAIASTGHVEADLKGQKWWKRAVERLDNMNDPAGVRYLLRGFEQESPIKGFTKGHLVFAVFMLIVIVLTTVQAVL